MNFFFRRARQSASLATAGIAGISIYDYVSGKEYVREIVHKNTLGSFISSTARTICEPMMSKENNVYKFSVGQGTKIPSSKPGTKLLFLGSGSSTGCPKPICALTFPECRDLQISNPMVELQNNLKSKCKISEIANHGDPRLNKNYRNNPSLLISHRNNDQDGERSGDDSGDNDDQPLKNVIIDVGKTFREGALRWMPYHGIYHLDAVVITHEHADAFMGMDDLRGFQIARHMISSDGTSSSSGVFPSMSLPVYLSPNCLETVKKTFTYLIPKHLRGGENDESPNKKKDGPKVVRHVAALDFRTVHQFKPFFAAGLKMIPLPVKHGEDFICNGYAFSVKGDRDRGNEVKTTNVVYLSDISRMLPETERFILESLPPTDILVVDSLLCDQDHAVHFSLNQALDLVKRLKPKRTFIVGMNCDDFPEHDEANDAIMKRNATVQLAHDGLAIEL